MDEKTFKGLGAGAILGLIGGLFIGSGANQQSRYQQSAYRPPPDYREFRTRIREESNQAMECGQCHEGGRRVYDSRGRGR